MKVKDFLKLFEGCEHYDIEEIDYDDIIIVMLRFGDEKKAIVIDEEGNEVK